MGQLQKMACAIVVSLAAAFPAVAQDLTNAQRDATIEFVLNNTRHVLLHEAGHLLVDQFDLPVLGKEEDAVDMLATLLLLDEGTEDAITALRDTVDGWLHSEDSRPTRGYVNADFYGAHSLDIQRSYAIACLMVGRDYEEHSAYATRVSLPIDRQESCAEDHRVAEKGWKAVLHPHLRTGAFGEPVTTVYRSSDPEFSEIAAILRNARVLEQTADWLTKTYMLPNPITISAESCGEVNAFYVADDREVILCYEWADFFFDLFVTEILPVREHFAQMRALKLEKLGRPQ